MKKFMIAVCMVICIAMFIPSANADLIDRGRGLIYDTDLNITWFQTTQGNMGWSQARSFVSALEYSGYDDWRLPNMTTCYFNWTTNPNASELAHLSLVDQINFNHSGPFTLSPNYIWVGGYWGGYYTSYGGINTFSSSWPVTEFYTNGGWSGNFTVWPVRTGDVTNLSPVPEPASLLLLGSGLVVIGGYGRKNFFKK